MKHLLHEAHRLLSASLWCSVDSTCLCVRVEVKLNMLCNVPFWASPPWGHRGASTSPRCDAGFSPGFRRSHGTAAAAQWSWTHVEVGGVISRHKSERKILAGEFSFSQSRSQDDVLTYKYFPATAKKETTKCDKLNVVCNIETAILTNNLT